MTVNGKVVLESEKTWIKLASENEGISSINRNKIGTLVIGIFHFIILGTNIRRLSIYFGRILCFSI